MTVDRTTSFGSLVRGGIVFVTIFAVVCVAFSGSGAAVPAAPIEHPLSQPDGTTFNATQWGTEDNHGWQTTQGYTIIQGSEGWWWYATVESGELVPTDHKVGIDEPPTSVRKEVRGAARTSVRQQHSGAVTADQASTQGTIDASPIPTTGTVKYPVILITYPDKSTTATADEFQRLLYGNDPAIASGPGSMRDYYLEASNGQLKLDGNVSGWVTADHSHGYYSTQRKAAELVQEAVKKADGQINYSQYDNNGDGYVDGVIVIHQGGGQEATGNPADIWSHQWSLAGAAYYGAPVSPYASNDGVTINSYSVNPETYRGEISTIGIFAHETGHLLGMTDLYDTDGGSQGIGEWGLMGTGSWNYASNSFPPRQGSSPAHPVAFHKWQQGWITPTQQARTGPMGILGPYARTSDTFQWLENPNGAEIGGTGEYFLATYREQTGFDQGLPGEGVLITHIDETRESNQNEDHKLVDIEAADGNRDLDNGANRGDPGDVFPSQTGEGFGPNTTPSSGLHDESKSGIRITEIDIREYGAVLNPAPRVSINPKDILQFSVNSTNTTPRKRVTKNVTISNKGTEAVNLTTVSVTGPDAANFTVKNNTTDRTLTPSEVTTPEIKFVSAQNGTYSATLVIEHTGLESPREISLQGTRGITSPVDQYDKDQNGIQTRELLTAIHDFRSGVLPITDLLDVLADWRAQQSSVAA